jgi:hypothetical protein
MNISTNEGNERSWQALYRVGGVSALLIVVTGLAEIAVSFLPGGSAPATTVLDWIELYRSNPFMGMRNMGLLNIIMVALGMPMTLALYGAHRRVNQASAALATVISFVGVATFFATNRAFPMLDLSQRYAAAATDAQRAVLIAAGRSMLSVGQSHSAGTYLAFFLAEIGGLVMAVVVLRGGVFSKLIGVLGLVANACFLIFEAYASFITGLSGPVMALAVCGGLLSMVWNVLIALRLFQLARA